MLMNRRIRLKFRAPADFVGGEGRGIHLALAHRARRRRRVRNVNTGMPVRARGGEMTEKYRP